MVLAQMHRSRRRRSALYKRPGDGLSGFGASRLALPFGQRAASEFLAARLLAADLELVVDQASRRYGLLAAAREPVAAGE